MKKLTFFILGICLFACPVQAATHKNAGKDALKKSLAYLNKNMSSELLTRRTMESDKSVPGALAFAQTGYHYSRGKYSQALRLSLTAMQINQNNNGRFVTDHGGTVHFAQTFMLAEFYKQHEDKKLLLYFEKALKYLQVAQLPSGAFALADGGKKADTMASFWVARSINSLKTTDLKNIKLQKTRDRLVAFVKNEIEKNIKEKPEKRFELLILSAQMYILSRHNKAFDASFPILTKKYHGSDIKNLNALESYIAMFYFCHFLDQPECNSIARNIYDETIKAQGGSGSYSPIARALCNRFSATGYRTMILSLGIQNGLDKAPSKMLITKTPVKTIKKTEPKKTPVIKTPKTISKTKPAVKTKKTKKTPKKTLPKIEVKTRE